MGEINTGLHYPIYLDNLPPDWTIDFVGKFCDEIQSGFACGRHQDTDIGVMQLRPMNVSREGQLNFDVVKYVPSDFDTRRLHENDVLFNNTNSPELIGKTALITSQANGLAFSNHMTRLKFHQSVLPKFGAFQLHYLWMARYFLHRCVKHVNQASVSGGELAKSIPFVRPPLPDQHRIVAKIEELFSELDKGIENLKTAQAQLKVYRQALLKHAFEGKLTAQWRAENQDKLETADALLTRIQKERQQRYTQQLAKWEAAGKQGSRPKIPKPLSPLTTEELDALPQLPKGWTYTRIGNLIDDPTYGTSKKCDYETNGVGVLRIPNVASGKIDASDLKFSTFSTEEIAAYRLDVGDILIIRSNGSISIVGQCALVSSADTDYLYAGYLIRLRPNQRLVQPEYLLNTFSLHAVRNQVEKKAKSTSGVNNINTGEIQSLIIALCGIEEQKQIIQELESKISEVDELEKAISTSLQQAESLRQSILKKAFSGQLVPQDPSDEPASALLARIKAEKANAAQPTPRRRSEVQTARTRGARP